MTARPRTAPALITLLLALLTLLACLPAAASAAPAPRLAPLDEDFAAAVAGGGGGWLPDPIKVSSGTAGRSLLRATALPAMYDLRALGRVPGVRDQNPFGTCWAFATMAALESRLLPGQTWDLSEDNLVNRNGFGPFADPYENGGNYTMAGAYLARWAGPVRESADPYPSPGKPAKAPVQKHVQKMVYLPPRSGALDNDAIKQAVMQYGAVATAMYWASGAYSPAAYAYFFSGTTQLNHGVAIVGWDDGFSRDLFTAGAVPAGDGAFLVRNSWGDAWGDDGYFWISYYDTALGYAQQSLAIGRVDAVGRYLHNYGYDRLGWIDSIGFNGVAHPETGWFAARFTTRSTERVRAAGFYAIVPGATYRVYAGASLSSLRLRGSGTLSEAGYHTVAFDTPLRMRNDRRFAVAVKLTTPGSVYPIPVETPVSGYAAATASSGQTYISPTGSGWQDLRTLVSGTNACLRAFTTR